MSLSPTYLDSDIRSTTGCYTCKARKKKCDEAHPKCHRCTRAGLECGGYAPLDNPDSKGVMRRAKITPTSVTSARVTPTSANSFNLRQGIYNAPALAEQPEASIVGYRSISDHGYADAPIAAWSSSSAAPGRSLSARSLSTLSSSEFVTALPLDPVPQPLNSLVAKPLTNFVLNDSRQPASALNLVPSKTSSRSDPYSDVFSRYLSGGLSPPSLASGQPDLLQASLSIADSGVDLNATTPDLSGSVGLFTYVIFGPVWPPPNLSTNSSDEQFISTNDDGLAPFESTMYKILVPDPNSRDNTTAFVVQAYSRWADFMMFEPSRVAHLVGRCAMEQYTDSPGLRLRIVLIANIFGSLSKTSKLSSKCASLVVMLQNEVHQALARFHSTEFAGPWDLDVQEDAINALEHTVEMGAIQHFVSSLSAMAQLMRDAAPAFRRACAEPSEELVNLPNLLLQTSVPSLVLRNFAVTDVILSVASARPMLFKYDVRCAPDMVDQMMNGISGLRWFHGVPDPFVILFARINVLHEDFGTNIDPEYVSDIEEQLQSIQIEHLAEPEDPSGAVWRLVVHECWRQNVYIYLYMVLCNAKANEPRVLKAVRAFTRLLNGIKSGRSPDSFLTVPMLIAGVSAYKAQDRVIIYRRLRGLQECNNPGTCVPEYISMLLELWKRTDGENRPAIWRDLRIACRKVTGV